MKTTPNNSFSFTARATRRINKAVKCDDQRLHGSCSLHPKNCHFGSWQPSRETKPTAGSGADEVHAKLLWGAEGRRVYEDVAACAPAPVACSQHADTAGSPLLGLEGGRIQSARRSVSSAPTVLESETMGNREKWDSQGSWRSQPQVKRRRDCQRVNDEAQLCVLEGKPSCAGLLNTRVAMCTPTTNMIETECLSPQQDKLQVSRHVSQVCMMIYCSVTAVDSIQTSCLQHCRSVTILLSLYYQ